MEKRGKSSKSITNRDETTAPLHTEVAAVEAVLIELDALDQAMEERDGAIGTDAIVIMLVPEPLGFRLLCIELLPTVVGTVDEPKIVWTGPELGLDAIQVCKLVWQSGQFPQLLLICNGLRLGAVAVTGTMVPPSSESNVAGVW